eukprot:4830625-Prymnesium_polylepis.1
MQDKLTIGFLRALCCPAPGPLPRLISAAFRSNSRANKASQTFPPNFWKRVCVCYGPTGRGTRT